VDLSGAIFGDGANLRGTRFGDGVDLSGAIFGDDVDLRGAIFGDGVDLSGATFGEGANLSWATFGAEAALMNVWFVGEAALVGVVFGGQQRMLGPLYAGGTVDLHDGHFGSETRLEIDAEGVVLSRAIFGGPIELRVLRARVEASETRFGGRATIAGLDVARRPSTGDPFSRRGADSLRHAEATPASVWSLRRTDVAQLTIAGVRITEARFAGAQSLEQLRLIDTKFQEHRGRQRVREETLLDQADGEPTLDEQRMGHPNCTPEQVAEIYRSLRKSREDAADAPGGNDLYVGEQRMRRRALREQASQTAASRARRVLLALYDWIGGYGVRSDRPFVALLVLLALAWPLAASPGLSEGGAADALVFVMRSMLLLPNTHNITTTTAGDAIQVVLRLLGPLLFALIAFGLRAQIKR
jgi:hypothetical protein